MRNFAGFLYDHRLKVSVLWGIVLAAFAVVAFLVGPSYKFDININDTESIQGYEALERRTPEGLSDQLQIVWGGGEQNIYEPEVQRPIEALVRIVEASPYVDTVIDPYIAPQPGLMQGSYDGKVGYATVNLRLDSFEIPPEAIRDIVDIVESTASELPEGIEIGISGQAVTQANPPSATFAEGVGILVALMILVLAFGAVLAAALPVVSAVIALGMSLATVTVITHFMSIPSFAPQLVSLLGIGVGIDYALFVVSRHRSGLMAGKSIRESVIDAFDTSGRAVVFAGVTVVIALLGILVTGIGFLNALAVTASIGVLFTMLVTITLLPAMLGFLGYRVLNKKRRELVLAGASREDEELYDEEKSTRWEKWSLTIQKRPLLFTGVSVLLIALLAIPSFSLRLGSADQGSDPQGSPTRVAYDLISEGFGPGANGTLLVVTEEDLPGLPALRETIAEELKGRATVLDYKLTADEKAGTITIIPNSAPQDVETSDLINDLRQNIIPDATNATVYVTGLPAVFEDFGQTLQDRLPLFIAVVLLISGLVLLLAFRSLAVPAKAIFMNVGAAAASFGVLVMVFQWGWGLSLIGVDRTGPIEPFVPVLLLAILFGLSMDYQVFLVSRIREEWIEGKDNTRAVTLGLAETGKVITAAALIMIAVFVAFVFGGERVIKMFGIGLAVAIFLDAFVVRSVLVPSLMQVLGKWNWWIPRWLDRVLPHVTIEPEHQKVKNVVEDDVFVPSVRKSVKPKKAKPWKG